MTPEFSHIVSLDRSNLSDISLQANAEERRAVAERLGLVSIEQFSCRFRMDHLGGGRFSARVHLKAKITQTCGITAEPFPEIIDEESTVIFVPEEQDRPDLDPDAPDEIPYTGHSLDLGEAAVEQLALSMESFPQKPDAILPESFHGMKPANDHPFAKLANWQPEKSEGDDREAEKDPE